MTSPGATALFLHIGRGKSGSSTIQSLAKEFGPFMEAAGVFCPLTLHGVSNHHRLVKALCDPADDRATVKKFRKDLARSRDRKMFLSAEALFSLTNDGFARLKRLVGDRALRVLFYVRDYPGWLPSVYAQRTKRAENVEDIDELYRQTLPKVSILPHLERWAAAFGWETLRVRPLDSRVLVGGSLVSDVLHAIGVEAPPPDVPALNLAPHWITLECQRALAIAAAAAAMDAIDPRSRRLTRTLFADSASDIRPSRVQYLTRAQWRELAALYRDDLAVIGERMGMAFPVSLEEPGERPFLPSFDTVPAAAKAAIRSRLHMPIYANRMNPQVQALVERLIDGGATAATRRTAVSFA